MDRLCRGCNVTKPIDGFKKDKTCANGYRHVCIDCFRASQRDRHVAGKSSPEYMAKLKEIRRRHDLKSKYGMSEDEYVSLFESQDGKCWICQCVSEKKRLSVDHSHSSGRVRGLLCMDCNQALGKFKDSTALLSKAIEYLKK